MDYDKIDRSMTRFSKTVISAYIYAFAICGAIMVIAPFAFVLAYATGILQEAPSE